MLHLHSFGGQGPKAYFLHGFGADAQSWVANVAAVSGSMEAVGIDLPGHGQSREVPVPDSLEQIAEQVLDSIDTTAPCVLIGHSAGGAIAMLCATRLQVSALSLIAPVGLGCGVNQAFVQQLPAIKDDEAGLSLLQTMVENKRLISAIAVSRLQQQLNSEDIRQQWRQFASLLEGSTQALTAAKAHIVQSNISRQVCWGKHDTINPLLAADQNDFGGQWHVLDECGHLPHIEQWASYNTALSDLIQNGS